MLWEWRDSNPQCRMTTDLQSAKQPIAQHSQICRISINLRKVATLSSESSELDCYDFFVEDIGFEPMTSSV
jgi:hypothetical protein